jgi:hypothetical protein
LKTTSTLHHHHEQRALKDGSSADERGSSHGRTWSRSKTSNNDEAKPDAEKSLEEVAAEQDRVPEAKIETKIEAGTCLQWPPNRIVWFPKLDHLVSLGSEQKKASRTTAPRTAPTPYWCPPGLTPRQRRIQHMRAQKMREEAAMKEREEHFNTI